ncbi:hypothetical protein ADK60_01300 [Streptomyces sp. XY431]|nr:hypothetical protein ADK60_01300 [Streptomyces sp. XY431]
MRDLANTYVWTDDGGFFAETTTTTDSVTETTAGSDTVKDMATAGAEFGFTVFGVGIGAQLDASLGGSRSVTRTRARDASRSYALDADGRTRLSRRVANDEPELLNLIADVLALADGEPVTWVIDMTGGEPALLVGRPRGRFFSIGSTSNSPSPPRTPAPSRTNDTEMHAGCRLPTTLPGRAGDPSSLAAHDGAQPGWGRRRRPWTTSAAGTGVRWCGMLAE